MGKRGPAATPTKILKLRGSWRAKDRKNEPQPKAGHPRCPAWLKPEAKAAWKELVEVLDHMQILTLADRGALTRYCVAWRRWRAAEQVIADDGETYTDEVGRYKGQKVRPEVAIAKAQGEILHKLEQQFGLTPAARPRLEATSKPEQPASGKGRFFGSA